MERSERDGVGGETSWRIYRMDWGEQSRNEERREERVLSKYPIGQTGERDGRLREGKGGEGRNSVITSPFLPCRGPRGIEGACWLTQTISQT